MHRDQALGKLRRMAAVIQSGELPAAIRGLYVFGSFSRGALSPGDLDLILWYAEPDPKLLEECKHWVRERARNICEQVSNGHERFEKLLRQQLRKRGEKVDLIVTRDLDMWLDNFHDVPREEFRLIWSPQAPDIEKNLAALPVDTGAGRAERHQFASPKRIGTDRESVEQMTKMLDDGELVLTRMALETITPSVTGHYLASFEHWTRVMCLGRDTQKCLPYAMWWLQQQKAGAVRIDGTVVWGKDRTRRVQMGRLHLHQVGWYFGRLPRLKRQCLIPHIKRDQSNELLIFERGSNWKSSDYAKIEHWSAASPGL